MPYIKLWNAGQRIIVNKIEGYLQVSFKFMLYMNILPILTYFSHVLYSIL